MNHLDKIGVLVRKPSNDSSSGANQTKRPNDATRTETKEKRDEKRNQGRIYPTETKPNHEPSRIDSFFFIGLLFLFL